MLKKIIQDGNIEFKKLEIDEIDLIGASDELQGVLPEQH
jgi:hypothetical protein